MSTGFDPYHAWLGMPPGSRPTNHYELLGLKLFASEPPVIAEAADERLAKVRAQLDSPQAAVAKQLLEQISTARATLLSAANRRAYDAQLRTQLGMPPAAEAHPAAAARPAVAAAPPVPAMALGPAAIPTQAVPMQAMPVQAVPMQAVPVQAVPMQAVPVQAVPMQAVPVQAVPMQAVPMAAVPMQAVPMAVPQGMPQAMPMMAQAVPMAPGMAMAHQAMPMGYAAPAADTGLEEIEGRRRRRRRRASGGQMIAIFGVLLIVGAVAAVGYVKRGDLLAALEDKPPVVIHEGDDSPKEPSQPKRPAKAPAAGPKQIATHAPAKQPPPNQFTKNLPAIPEKAPPKRVRPRATNPVQLKSKAPRAVASVSIKPQTPEEKAAVGQSLAAAREALAERSPARFEEQLNLAMLDASSSESMAAIDRMRTLHDTLNEFWRVVHESVKGLKSVDEIEIDGKKMIVIDADSEHLSVRADGKSEDYKIEKLPTRLALQLAEQWLQPNDPNSKVVLGAFLAVDPRGNRQEARQLWREAAGRGSEVAKTLLAQDAD